MAAVRSRFLEKSKLLAKTGERGLQFAQHDFRRPLQEHHGAARHGGYPGEDGRAPAALGRQRRLRPHHGMDGVARQDVAAARPSRKERKLSSYFISRLVARLCSAHSSLHRHSDSSRYSIAVVSARYVESSLWGPRQEGSGPETRLRRDDVQNAENDD